MSMIDESLKKEYYEAIDNQMKQLNDIMAELGDIALSDIDIEDYRFKE